VSDGAHQRCGHEVFSHIAPSGCIARRLRVYLDAVARAPALYRPFRTTTDDEVLVR
jgi:hypothetical protein